MFDRNLIETFAVGGQKLRDSVRGLTEAQLDAFPIAGTWSIRQIVVHLQDSDAVAIERMKRIAAMENPLMLGYDEQTFIRRLFPEAQPVAEVIDLFDVNRRLWAITMRKLPDEAFERSGIHNERGKVMLGQLVGDYARHLDHHMGFIHTKRDMLRAK